MDYAFDGHVMDADVTLPTKRGRVVQYQDHPDYSRMFKSQYGAVFARHLIEDHTRRVVINLTLSPKNIDQVSKVYAQVVQLQQYAHTINSPTEVLFTFSPLIWRPHQTRGDDPVNARATTALGLAHGESVNLVFAEILHQEYKRIKNGSPRLLANSAGYTELMANPAYWPIAVAESVPYNDGKPEILQVNPDGSVDLDCMFKGPELVEVRSTFGYRDRDPRKEKNPFTQFHNPSHGEWFPNIVTT